MKVGAMEVVAMEEATEAGSEAVMVAMVVGGGRWRWWRW